MDLYLEPLLFLQNLFGEAFVAIYDISYIRHYLESIFSNNPLSLLLTCNPSH